MALLGTHLITAPVGIVSKVCIRTRSTLGPGHASVPKFAMPSRFVPDPPTAEIAPDIVGDALVGQVITALAGRWFDTETIVTTLYVDGVPVALPHTLTLADDGKAIHVEDVATGPGGTATVATDPVVVRCPVPALDPVADIAATVGDAPLRVQVTGSDLIGGAWSVTGSASVTISASGVLTVDPAVTLSTTVTVAYGNSGGTTQRNVFVSVAPPASTWTPAALGGDFCVIRFDRPEGYVLDAEGRVAWAHAVFGGALSLGALNPAPHDAAVGAIDLSGAPGRALDGVLPFAVVGPRNALGTGDDLVPGVTVLWASVGETQGAVAGFRRSAGLARWRCGTGDVFGITASSPAWRDAGAHIRCAMVRMDGSTRQVDTWIDGMPEHVGQLTSSGSQSGTDSTGLSIGAAADGTLPANGTLQCLVVIRGLLSKADRETLEGWMAHNLGLFTGSKTLVLSATHSYRLATPTIGQPPAPGHELPSFALHAGVHMEPLDLRPYWIGAHGFGGTSLPRGLSVSGHYLLGKPTEEGSGSYTITASNEFGATPRSISITVNAAPAGAATTAGEVWALAAAADPGDTVTLAESLTSTADRTLGALSALTGNTALTLIGFTDFRDGAPDDVDYESRVAVPYTDAAGDAQTTTAPALTAHPLFGAAGQGQWLDAAGVSTAWPLDHLAGGVPAGLALGSYPARTMNSLGHNAISHDGHIVWLAEYEMADGSTVTAWEELDNTRGANPKLPLRHAARDAVRLRRFATFRRATHAAMRVNAVHQSPDPRTWATPARRERHDYTPAATPATWAAVSSAIEALAISATVHVVGLPAATMPAFSLTSAARTRLAAIRDAGGRVFLIGTPGQTVIPEADVSNCVGLDFGWVTLTRPDAADAQRNAVLRGANCEVAFHGVVLDGLDATFQMLGNPGGNAVWAFADCYVGGINGHATASNVTNPNAPRALFARCLIDVANDGYSLYGPGSLRYESCYLIGSGGAYNNAGFMHNDLLGQNYGQKSSDELWVALWDNVLDSGPGQHIPDLLRGEPSLTMMQGGILRCYDFVGNILMQPVVNGGFARVTAKVRRPADGVSSGAWWANVHLAHNLFLYRPDLVRVPWGYPRAGIETIDTNGEQSIDTMLATGNLLMKLPVATTSTKPGAGSGFSRAISVFPEEVTAGFRGVTVANALASFPAVSGTWAEGYTLDWSGTTYAGTSREGFIAPEDCVVAAALLAWGDSPVRGLPHDADYVAAHFTGLPADIRVFLGFVDAWGAALPCGYGADWFGGYAPTPGSIAETVADPWGEGADDRAIVVNTRLGTLSTGTIIEEVDADDADRVWRLEIIDEDGAKYPRWSMTDGSGAVVYRWTSAWPVQAGSHILASVSTRFRPHAVESFQIPERIAAIAFDHYQRAGETDELSIVFEAAASAPTIPSPTAGSAELFVWCDLSDFNAVKVWTGSAWAVPAEHLRDVAACMFLEEWSRITANAGSGEIYYALSSAQLGPMKWRLTVVEAVAGAPSTVHTPAAPSGTNARGDRLWSVTNGAVSTGHVGWAWTGAAWLAWAWSAEDLRVPGGEKAAAIVVDGRSPVRRAGDMWGTTDRFKMRSATLDARAAALTVALPFVPHDPAHVTVSVQCWRTTPSEPRLSWIASAQTMTTGYAIADGVLTIADQAALLAPVLAQTHTASVGPLTAQREATDAILDETEANRVLVTVSLAVNGDALAGLYGQEMALPRGTVKIGGDCAAPYGGTLGFVEARRIAGTEPQRGQGVLWRGPLDAANGAVGRRFARAPLDAATGARDHPRLGAAEVWRRG